MVMLGDQLVNQGNGDDTVTINPTILPSQRIVNYMDTNLMQHMSPRWWRLVLSIKKLFELFLDSFHQLVVAGVQNLPTNLSFKRCCQIVSSDRPGIYPFPSRVHQHIYQRRLLLDPGSEIVDRE
jgi:hypothetical protein